MSNKISKRPPRGQNRPASSRADTGLSSRKKRQEAPPTAPPPTLEMLHRAGALVKETGSTLQRLAKSARVFSHTVRSAANRPDKDIIQAIENGFNAAAKALAPQPDFMRLADEAEDHLDALRHSVKFNPQLKSSVREMESQYRGILAAGVADAIWNYQHDPDTRAHTQRQAMDFADSFYRDAPTEESLDGLFATYSAVGRDVAEMRRTIAKNSATIRSNIPKNVLKGVQPFIDVGHNEIFSPPGAIFFQSADLATTLNRTAQIENTYLEPILAATESRIISLIKNAHTASPFYRDAHLGFAHTHMGDSKVGVRYLEEARQIFRDKGEASPAPNDLVTQIRVLHRIAENSPEDAQRARDRLSEAESEISILESRQGMQDPASLLQIDNLLLQLPHRLQEHEEGLKHNPDNVGAYHRAVAREHQKVISYCTGVKSKDATIVAIAHGQGMLQTAIQFEKRLDAAMSLRLTGETDEAQNAHLAAQTTFSKNKTDIEHSATPAFLQEAMGRMHWANATYAFKTGDVEQSLRDLRILSNHYGLSSAAQILKTGSNAAWVHHYGIVDDRGNFSSGIGEPSQIAKWKKIADKLLDDKASLMKAMMSGAGLAVVSAAAADALLGTHVVGAEVLGGLTLGKIGMIGAGAGLVTERAYQVLSAQHEISAAYKTGIANVTTDELAERGKALAGEVAVCFLAGGAARYVRMGVMQLGANLRAPLLRGLLSEAGYVAEGVAFHEYAGMIHGTTDHSAMGYLRSILTLRALGAGNELNLGSLVFPGEAWADAVMRHGFNTATANIPLQALESAIAKDLSGFSQGYFDGLFGLYAITVGGKIPETIMRTPQLLAQAKRIHQEKQTHKLITRASTLADTIFTIQRSRDDAETPKAKAELTRKLVDAMQAHAGVYQKLAGMGLYDTGRANTYTDAVEAFAKVTHAVHSNFETTPLRRLIAQILLQPVAPFMGAMGTLSGKSAPQGSALRPWKPGDTSMTPESIARLSDGECAQRIVNLRQSLTRGRPWEQNAALGNYTLLITHGRLSDEVHRQEAGALILEAAALPLNMLSRHQLAFDAIIQRGKFTHNDMNMLVGSKPFTPPPKSSTGQPSLLINVGVTPLQTYNLLAGTPDRSNMAFAFQSIESLRHATEIAQRTFNLNRGGKSLGLEVHISLQEFVEFSRANPRSIEPAANHISIRSEALPSFQKFIRERNIPTRVLVPMEVRSILLPILAHQPHVHVRYMSARNPELTPESQAHKWAAEVALNAGEKTAVQGHRAEQKTPDRTHDHNDSQPSQVEDYLQLRPEKPLYTPSREVITGRLEVDLANPSHRTHTQDMNIRLFTVGDHDAFAKSGSTNYFDPGSHTLRHTSPGIYSISAEVEPRTGAIRSISSRLIVAPSTETVAANITIFSPYALSQLSELHSRAIRTGVSDRDLIPQWVLSEVGNIAKTYSVTRMAETLIPTHVPKWFALVNSRQLTMGEVFSDRVLGVNSQNLPIEIEHELQHAIAGKPVRIPRGGIVKTPPIPPSISEGFGKLDTTRTWVPSTPGISQTIGASVHRPTDTVPPLGTLGRDSEYSDFQLRHHRPVEDVDNITAHLFQSTLNDQFNHDHFREPDLLKRRNDIFERWVSSEEAIDTDLQKKTQWTTVSTGVTPSLHATAAFLARTQTRTETFVSLMELRIEAQLRKKFGTNAKLTDMDMETERNHILTEVLSEGIGIKLPIPKGTIAVNTVNGVIVLRPNREDDYAAFDRSVQDGKISSETLTGGFYCGKSALGLPFIVINPKMGNHSWGVLRHELQHLRKYASNRYEPHWEMPLPDTVASYPDALRQHFFIAAKDEVLAYLDEATPPLQTIRTLTEPNGIYDSFSKDRHRIQLGDTEVDALKKNHTTYVTRQIWALNEAVSALIEHGYHPEAARKAMIDALSDVPFAQWENSLPQSIEFLLASAPQTALPRPNPSDIRKMDLRLWMEKKVMSEAAKTWKHLHAFGQRHKDSMLAIAAELTQKVSTERLQELRRELSHGNSDVEQFAEIVQLMTSEATSQLQVVQHKDAIKPEEVRVNATRFRMIRKRLVHLSKLQRMAAVYLRGSGLAKLQARIDRMLLIQTAHSQKLIRDNAEKVLEAQSPLSVHPRIRDKDVRRMHTKDKLDHIFKLSEAMAGATSAEPLARAASLYATYIKNTPLTLQLQSAEFESLLRIADTHPEWAHHLNGAFLGLSDAMGAERWHEMMRAHIPPHEAKPSVGMPLGMGEKTRLLHDIEHYRQQLNNFPQSSSQLSDLIMTLETALHHDAPVPRVLVRYRLDLASDVEQTVTNGAPQDIKARYYIEQRGHPPAPTEDFWPYLVEMEVPLDRFVKHLIENNAMSTISGQLVISTPIDNNRFNQFLKNNFVQRHVTVQDRLLTPGLILRARRGDITLEVLPKRDHLATPSGTAPLKTDVHLSAEVSSHQNDYLDTIVKSLGLQPKQSPTMTINAFLRGELGREPTLAEVHQLDDVAEQYRGVVSFLPIFYNNEVPEIFQIYTREFVDALATRITHEADTFRKLNNGREPVITELAAGDGRLTRALRSRGVTISATDSRETGNWRVTPPKDVATEDGVISAHKADIIIGSWLPTHEHSGGVDELILHHIMENPKKTFILIGDQSGGITGSAGFITEAAVGKKSGRLQVEMPDDLSSIATSRTRFTTKETSAVFIYRSPLPDLPPPLKAPSEVKYSGAPWVGNAGTQILDGARRLLGRLRRGADERDLWTEMDGDADAIFAYLGASLQRGERIINPDTGAPFNETSLIGYVIRRKYAGGIPIPNLVFSKTPPHNDNVPTDPNALSDAEFTSFLMAPGEWITPEQLAPFAERLRALPRDLRTGLLDYRLFNPHTLESFENTGIFSHHGFEPVMRLHYLLNTDFIDAEPSETIAQLQRMGYSEAGARKIISSISSSPPGNRSDILSTLMTLPDADAQTALDVVKNPYGRIDHRVLHQAARILKITRDSKITLSHADLRFLVSASTATRVDVVHKNSLGAVDNAMALAAMRNRFHHLSHLYGGPQKIPDEHEHDVASVKLGNGIRLTLQYGLYEAGCGMQITLSAPNEFGFAILGTIGFQESDTGIEVLRYQGTHHGNVHASKTLSAFREFTGGVDPMPWLATVVGKTLLEQARAQEKTLRWIAGERVAMGYPHLAGNRPPHIHSVQDARGPWDAHPQHAALLAEYDTLVESRPTDFATMTAHYNRFQILDPYVKIFRAGERRTAKLYDATAQNLGFRRKGNDAAWHRYTKDPAEFGSAIRNGNGITRDAFDQSVAAALGAMRTDPMFGKWVAYRGESKILPGLPPPLEPLEVKYSGIPALEPVLEWVTQNIFTPIVDKLNPSSTEFSRTSRVLNEYVNAIITHADTVSKQIRTYKSKPALLAVQTELESALQRFQNLKETLDSMAGTSPNRRYLANIVQQREFTVSTAIRNAKAAILKQLDQKDLPEHSHSAQRSATATQFAEWIIKTIGGKRAPDIDQFISSPWYDLGRALGKLPPDRALPDIVVEFMAEYISSNKIFPPLAIGWNSLIEGNSRPKVKDVIQFILNANKGYVIENVTLGFQDNGSPLVASLPMAINSFESEMDSAEEARSPKLRSWVYAHIIKAPPSKKLSTTMALMRGMDELVNATLKALKHSKSVQELNVLRHEWERKAVLYGEISSIVYSGNDSRTSDTLHKRMLNNNFHIITGIIRSAISPTAGGLPDLPPLPWAADTVPHDLVKNYSGVPWISDIGKQFRDGALKIWRDIHDNSAEKTTAPGILGIVGGAGAYPELKYPLPEGRAIDEFSPRDTRKIFSHFFGGKTDPGAITAALRRSRNPAEAFVQLLDQRAKAQLQKKLGRNAVLTDMDLEAERNRIMAEVLSTALGGGNIPVAKGPLAVTNEDGVLLVRPSTEADYAYIDNTVSDSGVPSEPITGGFFCSINALGIPIIFINPSVGTQSGSVYRHEIQHARHYAANRNHPHRALVGVSMVNDDGTLNTFAVDFFTEHGAVHHFLIGAHDEALAYFAQGSTATETTSRLIYSKMYDFIDHAHDKLVAAYRRAIGDNHIETLFGNEARFKEWAEAQIKIIRTHYNQAVTRDVQALHTAHASLIKGGHHPEAAKALLMKHLSTIQHAEWPAATDHLMKTLVEKPPKRNVQSGTGLDREHLNLRRRIEREFLSSTAPHDAIRPVIAAELDRITAAIAQASATNDAVTLQNLRRNWAAGSALLERMADVLHHMTNECFALQEVQQKPGAGLDRTLSALFELRRMIDHALSGSRLNKLRHMIDRKLLLHAAHTQHTLKHNARTAADSPMQATDALPRLRPSDVVTMTPNDLRRQIIRLRHFITSASQREDIKRAVNIYATLIRHGNLSDYRLQREFTSTEEMVLKYPDQMPALKVVFAAIRGATGDALWMSLLERASPNLAEIADRDPQFPGMFKTITAVEHEHAAIQRTPPRPGISASKGDNEFRPRYRNKDYIWRVRKNDDVGRERLLDVFRANAAGDSAKHTWPVNFVVQAKPEAHSESLIKVGQRFWPGQISPEAGAKHIQIANGKHTQWAGELRGIFDEKGTLVEVHFNARDEAHGRHSLSATRDEDVRTVRHLLAKVLHLPPRKIRFIRYPPR